MSDAGNVDAMREMQAAGASRWLDRPGSSGAVGALMDEYARAAEDFCAVVERLDAARWNEERPGPDPQTRSLRAVCAHVCGAAHRYADYIRRRRGLPFVELFTLPADQPADPRDVRPLLAAALRYTEDAVDGLHGATEEELGALTFQVRWGPTYDPDMLLEHAVMHLLRHRRQLQRWPA
jgi:uncharacterized damage-inducible protein DinB